jgi:hypothetical protein
MHLPKFLALVATSQSKARQHDYKVFHRSPLSALFIVPRCIA